MALSTIREYDRREDPLSRWWICSRTISLKNAILWMFLLLLLCPCPPDVTSFRSNDTAVAMQTNAPLCSDPIVRLVLGSQRIPEYETHRIATKPTPPNHCTSSTPPPWPKEKNYRHQRHPLRRHHPPRSLFLRLKARLSRWPLLPRAHR